MYRIILFLLITISLVVSGCSNVEASLISTNQEIAMGKKVAENLEKEYGVLNDPILQARVEAIGQKLVSVSDRKNLNYSFKILNTDEVNALAVPGGYIYIFKGLLNVMPTDDEIAGVLGHEIGHIVKRHSVMQIEKQLAMTLIFAVVFQDKALMLQDLAQTALMAGYSRSDEGQSDELSFKYTTLAGYNPYGALVTMHKLDDLPNKPNYGLFSSHPDGENRIKKMKKRVEGLNLPLNVILNSDGSSSVSYDDWTFHIAKASPVDKPLYRAYLMAGALYNIQKSEAVLNGNRFVVNYNNDVAEIYYGDFLVHRVYATDLENSGFNTVDDLTFAYITMFSNWLEKVAVKRESTPLVPVTSLSTTAKAA